jgi:crotonobetainyl-CoA:carnitine CoA-transferase CaiB-like acyl-CoA transferase
MQEVNPRIVFCTISGYGATGPYRDMPSHGIAYDTWAGQVPIGKDEWGFDVMEEHTGIGIHAGPVYGALAILAAVLDARAAGKGCYLEIAQSDAAAFFDWYRIESYQSYRRPLDEVYGNKADNYERRAPGTKGMKEGVRYQVHPTKDGKHVLFMASEQAFWKNFCEGLGRIDLFEKWPGSQYGDHARGNKELHQILNDIFRSKTAAEWIEFGNTHNTPIAPVNTPENIVDDPQFQHRLEFISKDLLDADMLPYPIKKDGADLPPPTKAPNAGQHTDEVLTQTLGYDKAKVAALRDGKVAF